MALFEKRKTCKDCVAVKEMWIKKACLNCQEGRKPCAYPYYEESDVLVAVEVMKEGILWHSKGCLCGNERKCRERIAELINEVFGVQEQKEQKIEFCPHGSASCGLFKKLNEEGSDIRLCNGCIKDVENKY